MSCEGTTGGMNLLNSPFFCFTPDLFHLFKLEAEAAQFLFKILCLFPQVINTGLLLVVL